MITLLLAFSVHAATLDEARQRYRDEFLDVNAHVELADALYRAGRPIDGYYVLTEASGWFSESEFTAAHARVVDAAPSETQREGRAFIARAGALWQRGDIKGMRALLNGPPRPGMMQLRGLVHIQDKRWVEAAYWLEASLKEDPENEHALYKLSSLYRKELKDPAGALKWDLLLCRLGILESAATGDLILENAATVDRVRHALLRRRDAAAARARTPEDLRSLLHSPDGDLRAEAALQAGKRKERALLADLLARFDDDVGVVTQNADYAAFQIAKAYPGALDAHQAGLLGSESPFVRGKVFNLYGDLDPARARPWVLAGLTSPDEYVRLRAHMAVSYYYAKDAVLQTAAAKARRTASGGLLAALERLKKRR